MVSWGKRSGVVNRLLSAEDRLASEAEGWPVLVSCAVGIAQLFGLSKKTVYRLLDRGLLKSSNAVRHKMILKASVDEFVAKTVNNG